MWYELLCETPEAILTGFKTSLKSSAKRIPDLRLAEHCQHVLQASAHSH